MAATIKARAPNGSNRRSGAPRLGDVLSALTADLHGEMRQRWPVYFPHRRRHGTPDIRLTIRECGYSVIIHASFEFPGAAPPERAVVKVRREQKHGSVLGAALSDRLAALSKAEFDEHRRAHEFFDGRRDGLSVVRPLDFIASHHALVVEHASGTDVSQLVKERSPLAQTAIERCGRWWRMFHDELHDATERPWGTGLADAALDQRCARLHRFGVPPALLADVRERIHDAARTVPPVQVPVSRVHGDCKLRHVWATTDRIQVLDFGNTKVGDSWVDPAAFVVELSLYALWRPRGAGGDQVDAIRRLLHAYFGGQPPEAFYLYVVDCLLKKWHRRLRKWGVGPGWTSLQGSLKTLRLDRSLERLYIDRWFAGQIRSWLALATGRPPERLRPLAAQRGDR